MEGGWVFISHSHKDLGAVRKIRNHLEKLGFEPLMFYLKCLSDENEIEELIKREIDERDWFIYADSQSARASRWVQTEREYIETLSGKNIFTVDLNGDLDGQLAALEHIARQMKVYVSYSHRDLALYRRIRQKLLEKDLLVLSDEDVCLSTESWAANAKTAIADASHNGFVLLLLTEAFANSAFAVREAELALASGGKVIPVYVGGRVALPTGLMMLIGAEAGVSIAADPTDEELERVVSRIIQRVEFCHSDYKTTYGFRSARTIHLPDIARIDKETLFECENLETLYIPDSVIYITADAFSDFPDLLVKCSKGSYAASFCKRNGIRYAYTDGENA